MSEFTSRNRGRTPFIPPGHVGINDVETTVYRAARLAYRLGRQDQQRILEVRLRKHFDSDVQAKQLRDLAEGMTDELVDFHAIVRAAEEYSTSPEAVNTAEPVHSRIPRSEVALRERHTETCPRISDPGSECFVCEVFQHLAGAHARHNRYMLGIKGAIGDREMRDDNPNLPLRSDANEIRRIAANYKSEWETVSEYEAVLRDHGYDFEGEADCIDWLRSTLARCKAAKEAVKL